MVEQKQQTLVFRDADGALYALPRETLTQHRVPAQLTAQLERGIGAEDVSGFGVEISGGNAISGPTRVAGLHLLGQWNLDVEAFNGAGIEVDNGGQLKR